jgi:Tol biopolymer transport system component
VATTGWTSDIYTTGRSGGLLNRLTSEPGIDYEPVWSRDGKEIYFTSSGRPEAPYGVFVMQADGSDVRLVTAHPQGTSGGLSPDGTRMAYVDGGGDVYVSDLDGGNAQLIADVGVRQECPGGIQCNWDATHPRWSPDGTTIAFALIKQSRAGARSGSLYLVHSDGTALHRVAGGPASVWDPEWSADGARITVVSDGGLGGSTGNVWVVIVAAAGWQVVTPYSEWGSGSGLPEALLFGSNWSPGGETVVYVTSGDFAVVPGREAVARGLWTIGAHGGQPHHLHTGFELYGAPAWRPQR